MIRSGSFSSDITQTLSSIKNERKIPKRRKLKKKKRYLFISPDEPDFDEISKEIEPDITEYHDYEDSDFLHEDDPEEEPFNFETEFVTPSELIKEKRLSQTYFTGTKFDELLEGKGITEGSIIEFCGRHQIGKTTVVTSLALDLLTKYPDAQIAFIDTKHDIQLANLHRTLLLRGYDEETILKKFFERILLFTSLNIFELFETLKTMVRGVDAYKKVSFIIIDSITAPFYHASANIRFNMKLTSEIQQLIFKLAKGMNKIVILTNLQLNLYRISESDDSETDTDSTTSTSTTMSDYNENEEEDDEMIIKPALGNFWSEILDLRVLISMDMEEDLDNILESDVLGNFIEITRKLTVLESSKMLPLNSVLVHITDTGVI